MQHNKRVVAIRDMVVRAGLDIIQTGKSNGRVTVNARAPNGTIRFFSIGGNPNTDAKSDATEFERMTRFARDNAKPAEIAVQGTSARERAFLKLCEDLGLKVVEWMPAPRVGCVVEAPNGSRRKFSMSGSSDSPASDETLRNELRRFAAENSVSRSLPPAAAPAPEAPPKSAPAPAPVQATLTLVPPIATAKPMKTDTPAAATATASKKNYVPSRAEFFSLTKWLSSDGINDCATMQEAASKATLALKWPVSLNLIREGVDLLGITKYRRVSRGEATAQMAVDATAAIGEQLAIFLAHFEVKPTDAFVEAMEKIGLDVNEVMSLDRAA